MPLLQGSIDSNVLPPHPDTANSETRSALVVEDTTFGTMELGLDDLLQVDSELKLCWDTPMETLLQSVDHVDPSLLTYEWPSDSRVEISETMPMATITTQFMQEKAPPGSQSSRPEPSLENLLPELFVSRLTIEVPKVNVSQVPVFLPTRL